MASYSLAETARILRVSRERLRYWERTALLRRDAVAAGESAADAGFDFGDLVRLRGLMELLAQGVPLRRIRRSIDRLREQLPELEEPLRALHVQGSSGHVVVRHAGLLIEPNGQLVLDFQAAGGGELAPLHPAAPGPGESALDWFERGCALDDDPARLEEAQAAYRRAIELEPAFADAHCNLGTLYYNRGARSEARRCYERALAAAPTHLEATFNLANVLEEEGEREAALECYRASVSADPFFPDAWLNLALLCEKLERETDAREHWRRYLQLVPVGPWSEVARQRLRED